MKYTIKPLKGIDRAEWLELRKDSIGGSDTPAIMGLNKYMSALEVFGLKTRTLERPDIINQYTFTGIVFEPILRDIFRFWDGIPETSFQRYIDFQQDKKLKKKDLRQLKKEYHQNTVKEPNHIYYSKKYPFMSANLDGLITDDFKFGKRKGILEIKTMNSWVYDKYEGGLPPEYFIQLQHYLVVTGFDYGRVFYLYDTNNYESYLFEADEDVQASIIKANTNFWNIVLKARELIKNNQPYQHLENLLIDGSEATEGFLKDRYSDPINDMVIEGNEYFFDLAKKLNKVSDMVKEYKDIERNIKNKIRKGMENAGVIDFGDNGKITYKANVKGVRVFRNNVKL